MSDEYKKDRLIASPDEISKGFRNANSQAGKNFKKFVSSIFGSKKKKGKKKSKTAGY